MSGGLGIRPPSLHQTIGTTMDLQELEKRTDRHQREIEDLRNRVTSVETTHSVNEVHQANVERRLASIEDGQKWIVRLILGAIILALIGAVLQGGVSLG